MQDELAALQTELATSKAAAATDLQQKTQELDSVKQKLSMERGANKREQEKSAQVPVAGN